MSRTRSRSCYRSMGFALAAITGLAAGCGRTPPPAELARQVAAAESSFAATMANRDSVAFAAFVSPEAIFFGDTSVMRGKAAVIEGWRRLFVGPTAPFSWQPEVVEVLESGRLALSSGPVFDPAGTRIGTFTSLWRRDPDGRWRVVFDKGNPACDCEPIALSPPSGR